LSAEANHGRQFITRTRSRETLAGEMLSRPA
jgi:hypothetical protein